MTSNTDSPEVSETSVILGLSQSFKILSEGGIQVIGDVLAPMSGSWVFLSVQEPLWNTVVEWTGHDIIYLLYFLFSELSRSLVEVNLGDSECEAGESSSNTLDLPKSVRSFLFTVDVSVLDSQNMSEVIGTFKY